MTTAMDGPKLTKKDFVSDQQVRWCPGCGDYAILSSVQHAFAKLGIPRHKIVIISGIGCAARFPYYVDCFGFHTIHGRAPALATGLKVSRPDLSVWVVGGDGDMLSIGGNHLLHALRRNVGIKILCINNRIYGLTKGQYSPTSPVGTVKKSTPMGSIDRPVNPISLALAAEAGFVARTVDVFGPHLQETLLRAAAHEGSVFVEVLQNCIIFNDAVFSSVTDRASREDNVLYLEHQKPLLFGAGGDKGIRLNGLKPEVVRVGEGGVPESELLVHDEKDESLAYLLSRMEGDGFPTPIGTFRTQDHVSYEAAAAQQVRTAREQKGEGDLMKLIHSGDVWTVQ